MKYLAALGLVSIILFWGCKKKQEGVLDINKMKVVFLHHMMAEEVFNNYMGRDSATNFDSARNTIYSSVLKINHTDSATFVKSLKYYKSDVARFKILMDSVIAYGNREKDIQSRLDSIKIRKKWIADSLQIIKDSLKLKKDTSTIIKKSSSR